MRLRLLSPSCRTGGVLTRCTAAAYVRRSRLTSAVEGPVGQRARPTITRMGQLRHVSMLRGSSPPCELAGGLTPDLDLRLLLLVRAFHLMAATVTTATPLPLACPRRTGHGVPANSASSCQGVPGGAPRHHSPCRETMRHIFGIGFRQLGSRGVHCELSWLDRFGGLWGRDGGFLFPTGPSGSVSSSP
ncbi:hypothetical protein U9M48_007292 [Paspalum notatum var. saurae]|uniref:Uncharacterized protein n=1 Tax=Paspalum notatum var. saurae TaxID=547442 RepID=A0AAQ3PU79_PASNO